MFANRSFRLVAAAIISSATLCAQPPQGGRGGPQPEFMRQAQQAIRDGKPDEALAVYRKELAVNPNSLQANNAAGTLLDLMGNGAEARKHFQRAIDAAPDSAAKANAHRQMAMSYGFEGDCRNTVKYEQMVIAYWVTREQAEPQNAFYQQGEMANEAARVCIDSGDLETAATWYRKGAELGLKEPGNQTHPKSLWNFRLEHALARIAARQGNKADAQKHVAAAKAELDGDPAMAGQQARFFPYLTGYVALYTGDPKTALDDLQKAVAMPGNAGDPFFQCLLGMTYEKLGEKEKAMECYRKAFATTAHNPPAAFAKPFARKKLG
jgi:tetratricopeptide (TPR) repeat protein